MKFTIRNVSDQDLDLTLIDFPRKFFKVDLPGTIKAGTDGEGTIKLVGDAVDQTFEKSFTLQANDEENSRFTVPVKRIKRVRPPKSASN